MIGESVITRRRRIDAGIDMTPLIDVVFQLLIFLMVSSQFTKPEQAIDLPQTPGESSLVDPSPDKLTVSLAENGEIFVNQELVALGDLHAKLSSWSASGNTKRVEIRGSSNSSGIKTLARSVSFTRNSPPVINFEFSICSGLMILS